MIVDGKIISYYTFYYGQPRHIEKLIIHWTDSAKDALEAAEIMFKKEKFAFSLFFGHLSLEKILKALVIKNTKQHTPYIHKLETLAELAGLELNDEQIDFLCQVTSFNLEGRCQEYIEKIKKIFTQKYTERDL